MSLAQPLLGTEVPAENPESKANSSGTELERSGHSVSGPTNVEALPFPVSAQGTRFRPPPLQPIREPASAAESMKNPGRGGGSSPVSAGSRLLRISTETSFEDDGDEEVGGGDGGEGEGEGYYAQKFSKFYTAFIATTSASQIMPRSSQQHPLASPLKVPDIEGDVDGMPKSPVTRDEAASEGVDTFNLSMSAPFADLGVQKGRGAGGRGRMLRRSASMGPVAFGGGRGRGGAFKRSGSLDAKTRGPSLNRTASFKRSDTLESTETRDGAGAAVAAGAAASVGDRLARPQRRFSGSRAVTAETKISELYANPLASEGEGSVFPLDLPTEKRVALEVEFIQKYDKLAINPNVGEFWMLIDAQWISRWSAFVLGQAGPPGPISNRRLFVRTVFAPSGPATEMADLPDDASIVSFASSAGSVGHPLSPRRMKVRPGLQAIKDYRAIHPMVWFIFREIYDTDGAPDLCRPKLDVYSPEILTARRTRILEPSHTRAVYQLRRFVARIKRGMLAEKEEVEVSD
eukprot:g17327.t1